MNKKPEYMEFAMTSSDIGDVPGFFALLRAYLEKNMHSKFGNRIRSTRIIHSQEDNLLFFDVSFAGRSLLRFHGTHAEMPFFLTVVKHVAEFMRFSTVQPMLVFYNDEISRSCALQNGQICEQSELKSLRFPPAGVAISFQDLLSFYACEVEGCLVRANSADYEKERHFIVTIIVYCMLPEDCAKLIGEFLRNSGAEVVDTESIEMSIPVIDVPNFECLSFSPDSPRIIHSTGRVFFD